MPPLHTFDTTDTDLRRLIARAMREQGVTQTALAEASGTTQHAVSTYLAGKTDPRVSTVERWMTALGITIR